MPALDKKPDLPEDLLYYLSAFWALSRYRSSGFGVGYIPLTEVCAYMGLVGITERAERDEFMYFITALDDAYLGWHDKKTKTKKK